LFVLRQFKGGKVGFNEWHKLTHFFHFRMSFAALDFPGFSAISLELLANQLICLKATNLSQEKGERIN